MYKVKKSELLPYFNYAQKLIEWLGDMEVEHVPRKDNKQDIALTILISTIVIPEGEVYVPICKSWVIPPIFEDEGDG